MERTTTAVLAALLVIGTLAAVPVAMAQETGTDGTNETNGTDGNATVAPGEQLSGVVGVGEAELSGEVESRAYGVRVAQANSSDAKAAVVADQLNDTEERLADLESQRTELEAARENGSISEGQYRARMATLHAESQSAARLANQTNETAGQLPAETLEANGVNVTALRTLQDRAANLTGPETAEIARSIAGENAGQAARPDEAPERPGAGDRAGNESDRPGAGGSDAQTRDGSTNETRDGSTNETSDGSTATDDGSAPDDSDSDSTDDTDSQPSATRGGSN